MIKTMNRSELTNIPNLISKLNSKDFALTDYIDASEEYFNTKQPKIKAFLPEDNRFERLREEVSEIIKIFPNPTERPVLNGLPIGVKDIFHVDGFPTHAGCKLPPEHLLGPEAASVKVLKNHGALVLGKTVTTEFAYFAPGPTMNPHNLKHTPGGSSSGSAAAVAVGLVPFAFGTQTIGSVIRPASYCGVVGFKPSYGRISTRGVIPLAPSVDTVGYFTSDATSANFMGKFLLKDWNSTEVVLKKPKLGIPIGPYWDMADNEMYSHLETQAKRLENYGFQVKEVGAFPNFDLIYRNHNLIVAYEAAQTHKKWYQKYHDLYHPKTVELIQRGQEVKDFEYQSALHERSEVRNKMSEIAGMENIDIWLSPPAQGPAPRGLDSTGDPVMNLPWTYCGVPTINLPAGNNSDGLPMGLQLSADWMMDEALLNWAVQIEKGINSD